nr:Late embryogenesis abundant protein, LEA-14 protein [Ipomoea batatas]
MAPPTTPTPRRPFSPLRCIGIILLTTIIIVGLVILILWLAVRPHRPIYFVENGAVHNFNLTADNRLTADFNFTLKAYNPNKRISISYAHVEAQLYFGNEQIAFATWPAAFNQAVRNVTYLPLFLPAKNVTLYGDTTRDFKNERSAGKVDLVIKINARVRFKMGSWRSKYRTLRVICTPTDYYYSSKGFKETKCDTDL